MITIIIIIYLNTITIIIIYKYFLILFVWEKKLYFTTIGNFFKKTNYY